MLFGVYAAMIFWKPRIITHDQKASITKKETRETMNINAPIAPHEVFEYERSGCNDGPFKNLDRNSSMQLARPSVIS